MPAPPSVHSRTPLYSMKMTYPRHNSDCRSAHFWPLYLGFITWVIAAHAAPKVDWAPVSAEELSNLKPQIESEAPAEIVFQF